MLWILTWLSFDGQTYKFNDYFLVNGEAYEEVSLEKKGIRFWAISDENFTVIVRFYRDGEYWQKTLEFGSGRHLVSIDLENIKDAELLPTRGLGRRNTIIILKGNLKVSDVEAF